MDFQRSYSVGYKVGQKAQAGLTKEEIDRIIEKEKKEREELREESTSPKLTSSFLATSREQRLFATRNHTESPRPTHYTPLYSAIQPKARALRFRPLQCKPCPMPSSPACHRSSRDVRKSPVKARKQGFDLQTYRPELSPSPMRQEFVGAEELDTRVFSGNRKVPGVAFSVLETRKTVWGRQPQPTYEPSITITTPRVETGVPFEKVPARKTLAITHALLSPQPPAWGRLQLAWHCVLKQTPKLPTMGRLSPRDDCMYRMLGAYVMNVPKKQGFTQTPKYSVESPSDLPRMPVI